MRQITKITKLKERPADGHKGSFGKVCIIGGSIGFSGAVAIAGRAALRSGSGLVRVAVGKSLLPVVAAIEPCFTTIPLAEDKDGRISSRAISAVLKAAGQNDVLAFGPGAGISQGVKNVLEQLLRTKALRLVVDADGLNNLAKLAEWTDLCKAELILTPHPGEMKRLWPSLLREPIPTERTAQAIKLAQRTGAVVVLKGKGTVVADSKRYYVNTTGNPGMATAGSGDVLTGIITSLCGQGLSNFDAAVLGVYVHGLASDLAAGELGRVSLIATDIIEYLPRAFQRP